MSNRERFPVDFNDETYVRLYTRDTATWKSLSWEGKCLLPLLLRKCDRAGIVELGKLGTGILPSLLDSPDPPFVERGVASLLEYEVIAIDDENNLTFPRFIEAQECRSSDRIRQKNSRESRRNKTLLKSKDVTSCHTASQAVTSSHPVSPYATLRCATHKINPPNPPLGAEASSGSETRLKNATPAGPIDVETHPDTSDATSANPEPENVFKGRITSKKDVWLKDPYFLSIVAESYTQGQKRHGVAYSSVASQYEKRDLAVGIEAFCPHKPGEQELIAKWVEESSYLYRRDTLQDKFQGGWRPKSWTKYLDSLGRDNVAMEQAKAAREKAADNVVYFRAPKVIEYGPGCPPEIEAEFNAMFEGK